jgi:hypothetical protein
MVKRISSEEATQILMNNGLRPLEPYKNSKTRWKSIHIECGTTCFPLLEKVKLGQIGCPTCRYKKAAKSLKFPEEKAKAIMVAAGYEPIDPYVNALTKWKCKHLVCGRIVYPLLNTIQSGGGGCKECGSKATGLAKRNPKEKVEIVLKEKDLILIGEYRDSHSKIKVKCKRCDTVFFGIYTVISRESGRGCKNCALIASAEKFRLSPDVLLKRLAKSNLVLEGTYKNSKTTLQCRCLKCNKSFGIYPGSLSKGSGCPTCNRAAAGLLRRNEEKAAIQVMISVGQVEPLEPYPGAGKRWKSQCINCAQIVFPTYSGINGRKQGGCKYCADKKRGIARRIPQEKAYALFLENGFIPVSGEKYLSAETQLKCKHSCGATVSITYRRLKRNIAVGSGSCRPCGNKKYADSTRFSIEQIDKIYAKQKLKLARRKYLGMRYKHPTVCLTCGWKWETLPSKIALGHGCPSCAKSSFKPDMPGYLYLITHNDLNAHKVGIANLSKTKLADRFYHHQKQGWSLVARWNFESGSNAQNIEREILSKLRKEMGIPAYLSKDDMPFGGWTETMSADAISLTKLRRMMEKEVALSLTHGSRI